MVGALGLYANEAYLLFGHLTESGATWSVTLPLSSLLGTSPPTTQAWMDGRSALTLPCLPWSWTFSFMHVMLSFLQIFSILGAKLIECERKSKVEADHLRGRIKGQIAKLRDSEVIPTKANKWASISSQPMIADDKAMERLFQTNDQVSFVNIGEKLKRSTGQRKSRTQGTPLCLLRPFKLRFRRGQGLSDGKRNENLI